MRPLIRANKSGHARTEQRAQREKPVVSVGVFDAAYAWSPETYRASK
jgi:hypothetical protein